MVALWKVRAKFALCVRKFVVLADAFFSAFICESLILTIATGHRISVSYVRTVAPAP